MMLYLLEYPYQYQFNSFDLMNLFLDTGVNCLFIIIFYLSVIIELDCFLQ